MYNEELADNPQKRVPVCLCLDVSGSMEGDPIRELNEGVQAFYEAINEDTTAKQAADVCIVTFGSTNTHDQIEVVQDFMGIKDGIAPTFEAWGRTPMGGAVDKALNLLEARKVEYRNEGVDYFQPWLVIITDGEPTDDVSHSASRTYRMVKDKKLVIFPIAVGEEANLDVLAEFSPNNSPKRLKGLCFREFFKWLSASVATVSHSRPGERIELGATDEWSL